MEIPPEAAVKFEHRQWAVAGFHFLSPAERSGASQKSENVDQQRTRIEGEGKFIPGGGK